MKDFLLGLQFVFRGLCWLGRKDIRTFVIVPLTVNALLFSLAICWGGSRLGNLIAAIQTAAPDYLSWVVWLLWPVFILLALLSLFFGFTLLANLLASPFNGLLAARVEHLADPEASGPPDLSLWQELLTAPVQELRKIIYFLFLAILPAALWLIPPLYPLLPFAWAGFGAWVLAVEYLDYPLGNWRLSINSQRTLIRRRTMLAFGFGCGVTSLTIVPIINFVAMPTAVIGATLLWTEQLKHQYLAERNRDEFG